jgi:lipoprotein-anchoring transpeptidase ErfK/SrfK
MRRLAEQILRVPQMKIEIDVASQSLVLKDGNKTVKTYSVSTAKNGAGEKNGSFCTPRGKHIIRAKIGAGDWMLTRILWLSGCEPGRNRLGDVDTMRRYIYLHGAPDSAEMGKPGSIGCVRMRNRDIVELFDLVPPYTEVVIRE